MERIRRALATDRQERLDLLLRILDGLLCFGTLTADGRKAALGQIPTYGVRDDDCLLYTSDAADE